MKIVLNRKGYMDERPVFITCILVALYGVLNRLGASVYLIIGSFIGVIMLYILSIFMCIYYDECLSVKVRKKSLIKYYKNPKYIIVDESTQSRINETIFNEYVNVDYIHHIYTNVSYSKDKKVCKAFLIEYKPHSKYADIKKTFLVYKVLKEPLSKA